MSVVIKNAYNPKFRAFSPVVRIGNPPQANVESGFGINHSRPIHWCSLFDYNFSGGSPWAAHKEILFLYFSRNLSYDWALKLLFSTKLCTRLKFCIELKKKR